MELNTSGIFSGAFLIVCLVIPLVYAVHLRKKANTNNLNFDEVMFVNTVALMSINIGEAQDRRISNKLIRECALRCDKDWEVIYGEKSPMVTMLYPKVKELIGVVNSSTVVAPAVK